MYEQPLLEQGYPGLPCAARQVLHEIGRVLTGFRLQEPFVQKGCPRLFSYDAVYGQVLILLVVLDRRFSGRAKLAILRWFSMS